MRVTNTLKDIIYNKINAILTPKIEAKSEELSNLTKECEKIKNIYSAEFDEMLISATKSAIRAFKKKHTGIEVAFHCYGYYRNNPPVVIKDIDGVAKKMFTNSWEFIQPYLTEIVKLETEISELRAKKDSIPNDIILELTLGATKADFEDILNKHLTSI